MDHSSTKYKLPAFLEGICPAQAYRQWLTRRARAHVKRDRERGNDSASLEKYKAAIHQAVLTGGDRDAYTGLALRWDLISRYNNEDAKQRGRAYKKEFGDLPTVDHIEDGLGSPKFVICSWRVNDAKNDLDLDEFRDLCRAVLAFSEQHERSDLPTHGNGTEEVENGKTRIGKEADSGTGSYR